MVAEAENETEVKSPSGGRYLVHWVRSGEFLLQPHHDASEATLIVGPFVALLQAIRRRGRTGYTVAVVGVGTLWLGKIVYKTQAGSRTEARQVAAGAILLARGGHFDRHNDPYVPFANGRDILCGWRSFAVPSCA